MKKKIITAQSRKLQEMMRSELRRYSRFSVIYQPWERKQIFANSGSGYNPYKWAEQIIGMSPSRQAMILRDIIRHQKGEWRSHIYARKRYEFDGMHISMDYQTKMICSQYCKASSEEVGGLTYVGDHNHKKD